MKLNILRYPSISTRMLVSIALIAWSPFSSALLPPIEVECCQRKDFKSEQCSRFALDDAKCEKAQANWQETFRRFSAMQRPPVKLDAAKFDEPYPARLETRLYYHHTGRFSNVIDDKMRFWNTIIGEGGVEEPSNALRIDVMLKGAPGSVYPKAEVSIDVINQDTGKMLAQQSARTGVFSDKGEYHATFLLQNTGCIPLSITARVAGSNLAQTRSIPFQCGE